MVAEFLLCKKIVYVMCYEIEICPMAYSAVKLAKYTCLSQMNL